MTPAQARNLGQLIGKRVVIKWRKPDDDWPHFTLLEIDQAEAVIKLKGEDFPDGSGRHSGNRFWADWSEVASIEELED